MCILHQKNEIQKPINFLKINKIHFKIFFLFIFSSSATAIDRRSDQQPFERRFNAIGSVISFGNCAPTISPIILSENAIGNKQEQQHIRLQERLASIKYNVCADKMTAKWKLSQENIWVTNDLSEEKDLKLENDTLEGAERSNSSKKYLISTFQNPW